MTTSMKSTSTFFTEDNVLIKNRKNLGLTPKEILAQDGINDDLNGKKYIALTYDVGEKEFKHFLPKLKYKLFEEDSKDSD